MADHKISRLLATLASDIVPWQEVPKEKKRRSEKAAQPDNKPEVEELRFNWNEIVADEKAFFIDPKKRRRKIPCIIAKFPQDLTVTIFGSRFRTKIDRKTSHLVHKSRNVVLRPYQFWEAGYNPGTPPDFFQKIPRWGTMVFTSGKWAVVPGDEQKFKGQIYKETLQRKSTGAWGKRDPEIINAVSFAIRLFAAGEEFHVFQKHEYLQFGLWDGLLPALMKGKFSQVEAAFKFAQEVCDKRKAAERFRMEDAFPTALRPYEIALVELAAEREACGLPGPPSAGELFDFIFIKLSEPEDDGSETNFRKMLDGVGLGWLKESRKKSSSRRKRK